MPACLPLPIHSWGTLGDLRSVLNWHLRTQQRKSWGRLWVGIIVPRGWRSFTAEDVGSGLWDMHQGIMAEEKMQQLGCKEIRQWQAKSIAMTQIRFAWYSYHVQAAEWHQCTCCATAVIVWFIPLAVSVVLFTICSVNYPIWLRGIAVSEQGWEAA